MALVGGTTFLISLIGFYKEMVIGSTFGLAEFLDTFTLAILIPTFIQNVFIGALKNIFIPNYISENDFPDHFQLLIVYIITGLVSICLLFILLFDSYFLETLYSGHTSDYYSLISKQLYIVLPCLFLWGYNAFLSALLEINSNYFYTSIAPVFISLTTIICVVFFSSYFGNLVLAVGVLLGSILNFLYLLIGVLHYRLLKFNTLKRFGLTNNMWEMIKQLPAKITSGMLTGINPFVDQIFAAQLIAGSVAALNYGNKIPAFTITIAMVALGNVLLPHFSKLVKDDLSKAYKELFYILKLIFVTASIAITILYFLSKPIIILLFERGSFSAENTEMVFQIQQILLIQIPFFLCTLILVKFLTSINKNGFMAWASLVNLLVNLLLNYILIEHYQVYGLAISTTLVLVVSSFIYLFFTYKTYKAHQNTLPI